VCCRPGFIAFSGLLLATAVAVTLASAAQVETPPLPDPPAGFVSDGAGVLDASTRAALDTLLKTLETDTTVEIAVATVTSLGGMTVDAYAEQLFRHWAPGQAGKDNGVLIVVAPQQREMRIEVGYGLEPILPDGLAGEIIRNDFLPRFRDDDYAGGIEQGVRRLETIVRRNEPYVAPSTTAGAEAFEWFVLTILAALVAAAGFEAGVGTSAKAVFPIVKGLVFGAVGPALGALLVGAPGRWKVFVLHLPVAVGMFAWGWSKGKRPKWRHRTRGRKPGSRWVWGSDADSGESAASESGSGSSGGSSGGSGDSFGGGRSGGGGASGHW
jgi:uncharacterized protein